MKTYGIKYSGGKKRKKKTKKEFPAFLRRVAVHFKLAYFFPPL